MPADFARMVLDGSLWVTLAMLDPEGNPYAVPVSIVRKATMSIFMPPRPAAKRAA